MLNGEKHSEHLSYKSRRLNVVRELDLERLGVAEWIRARLRCDRLCLGDTALDPPGHLDAAQADLAVEFVWAIEGACWPPRALPIRSGSGATVILLTATDG